MNLTEMRTIVRRDLHDEVTPYRWSDAELDRHIAHALKELSEALPYEQTATKATTADSREIDISTITNRIMLDWWKKHLEGAWYESPEYCKERGIV